MSDLKAQARAFGEAVAAKEAEAAKAWSSFDALRKSAVAEGVDFTKNADAFEKLNDASKSYDLHRDEVAAMKARHADLLRMAGESEPQSSRKADEREAGIDSIGARFTKSAVYADLKASGALDIEAAPVRTPGVKVASGAELKTLFSTTNGGAALFRNDRLNVMVPTITAPLNLLDVMPMGTTDVDTVEWVTETWTNAAATIAESTNATATTAAESAISFATATQSLKELAHFVPATKKMMQDASQSEQYINQRLINGLRVKLQSQLVAGLGTGSELTGLANIANKNTQARSTDSRADAIHKAITQIRINAEDSAFPSIIVLHPTDMETLRLEKATSGDYYYGGPSDAPYTGGTIWGLTPIVSTAATQGTAYVIDPQTLTLFMHSSGLSLSMSDSHSTYFVERKLALLATVRAALACYQPKGITQVTGL